MSALPCIDFDLSVTNERRLHDPHVQEFAAHVDLCPVVFARRYPRERDRAADRRREAAAGDLAFAYTVDNHFLVIAQHALVFEQQPDKASPALVLALCLQRSTADEVAIGLPADLLRRRPDVRAAERAVAGAQARLESLEALQASHAGVDHAVLEVPAVDGVLGTLAEHVDDAELAEFYRSLFESEARHHSTYTRLAKHFAAEGEVERRLEELYEAEAEIISEGEPLARMHS